MRVYKAEEPVENHNHSIWFEPEEGEDWGTLADTVYGRDRMFKPNRLCVIVGESSGQVHAFWSQAREVRTYGEGETTGERIVGTWSPDNRHDIPEHVAEWWHDAFFKAEEMVRDRVRKAKKRHWLEELDEIVSDPKRREAIVALVTKQSLLAHEAGRGEAASDQFEEGVKQAMEWLRADYEFGTGPDWREQGVNWISERLSEHRAARRAEAGA